MSWSGQVVFLIRGDEYHESMVIWHIEMTSLGKSI